MSLLTEIKDYLKALIESERPDAKVFTYIPDIWQRPEVLTKTLRPDKVPEIWIIQQISLQYLKPDYRKTNKISETTRRVQRVWRISIYYGFTGEGSSENEFADVVMRVAEKISDLTFVDFNSGRVIWEDSPIVTFNPSPVSDVLNILLHYATIEFATSDYII
jgi:hypothetical protein